jgi:hypothetical protein
MRRRATVGGPVLASLLVLAATAAAQPPLVGPPLTERVAPAPLVIVPSLTLSGEYNDNIVLNNGDRRTDGIFGITPGVDVLAQSPIYRLLAHVDATTLEYIDNSDLSRAWGRFALGVDGLYRTSPTLTLRLTDALYFDRDTSRAVVEGVSTGRDRTTTNILEPGADWTVSPLTRVRVRTPYTLQRFGRKDAHESDVVHGDVAIEHDLSPRFTGLLGYDFGYFDIKKSTVEPALQATTNTPRGGFIWRLTDVLRWRLEGGPSFVMLHHRLRVQPAALTELTRRFSWGTASVRGDAIVTTAGALGGPVLAYGAGGSVRFTEFMRGFILEFAPRFTQLKSVEGNAIDVRALTLPVYASYQLTSWLNVIGSYTFYQQRSDSTLRSAGLPIAFDADQNRLSLAVQVFYPIRID